MEHDAISIKRLHHGDHMRRFEGQTNGMHAHMPTRREVHFAFLQMEFCAGEHAKRTRVIIMQMRDDHIGYAGSIRAHGLQAIPHIARNGAASAGSRFLIKARIHHNFLTIRRTQQPDEVIKRHGFMRIGHGQQKICLRRALMPPIADGIDFPIHDS